MLEGTEAAPAMLAIRAPQMRVFEQQAEDRFIAELAAHFRREFAVDTGELSAADLETLMRAAVARARKHGLTWESSISGFITLMFNIAPNFDEHPAFRRALSDPALDEEDRIGAIFHRVNPEQWAEAEDAFDDAAWGLP